MNTLSLLGPVAGGVPSCPMNRGGSLLRSPAPRSHPKFCSGEGEEPKYQAIVDVVILVSRS